MYQVPFLMSLVRRDLGLNPGLSDHWQTLYLLKTWKVIIFLHLYGALCPHKLIEVSFCWCVHVKDSIGEGRL